MGPVAEAWVSQALAGRERVIHQAKAIWCLGGPVTDPVRLIGPLWEARPPDYMDISVWFAPLRLDLNWTEPKQ